MKRVLILIAVVLVVSTGLSYSVARWAAARRLSVPAARVHDAAWLKGELKLTGAQAADIDKLAAEFQAKLDKICAVHCAARFALGDELAQSTVDAGKAKACVERMNAAQAEAEQVTLAHILKVRALLNDDQARRYSQLIHDQVCTMPMGAP